MIKIRPHHTTLLIEFYDKKQNLLSDEEFVAELRKDIGDLHSDDFLIYWKRFLQSITGEFVCVFDFDNACECCDIRSECEDKSSNLRKEVDEADEEAIKDFNLEDGKVYNINEFLKN